MNTPHADVLLITVTEAETKAVFAALRDHCGREPAARYATRTHYSLGEIGGAQVWLVRSEPGSGGPGGALATVYAVIGELQPRAVMLVGTAFGGDPHTQRLGDLLVSTQIMLYDPQRIATGAGGVEQPISKGDRATATPWLLDRLRDGALDWPADDSPVAAPPPQVWFGLILSGDKLVERRAFVERLLAFEPDALGGEMEGAGLYVAATERLVPWILVKAISGWADGGQTDPELAARNAARFTLHTLARGGFAPENRKALSANPAELRQAEQDYRAWVRQRYGQIQILGMHAPVPLDEIFTDVVLLDRASAWQHYNLDELRQRASLGDPQYPGALRHSGLELVQQTLRLYLLGKPGSGKSTFLRYLALQAAQTIETALPILIDLKEWSRSGAALPDFLTQQITHSKTPHARPLLEHVLYTNHALLLFDGLDEVLQEQGARQATLQAIRSLASQHPHCRIVITCRTAADEHVLEGFTYAEVADFSPEQVQAFASKWFQHDPFKRERFLEALAEPAHAGLRDLARTPLLLTLLCLNFEASLRFSERRVDLYDSALDLLLQRWDASRSVERDGFYRKLPLVYKRRLLARIALETFERGELFVRRGDLERRVATFLARLPGAPPEEQIDGQAVLAAIEAQHGLLVARSHEVLAFSHLTFQEYFAARAIVENPSDAALTKLLGNIGDPRWREVLLMVASLLDEEAAERFFALFAREIGIILKADQKAQVFREWISTVNSPVGQPISFPTRAWRMFVGYVCGGIRLPVRIQRCALDFKNSLSAIQIPDLAYDFDNTLARNRTIDDLLNPNLTRDLAHKAFLNLLRNLSRSINPIRDANNDLRNTLKRSIERAEILACDLTLWHNFNRYITLSHEILLDISHARDAADSIYMSDSRSHTIANFLVFSSEKYLPLFSKLNKTINKLHELIDLFIQANQIQALLTIKTSNTPIDTRWLILAWHISLYGDIDHRGGLSGFWRSALANLPNQQPEVQNLRTALEACAVPADDAPLEAWQQWLVAVQGVLEAHQHMGLEWAAERVGGKALGPYLTATTLLYECLKQASVADRAAILDTLLTAPAERPMTNDQ